MAESGEAMTITSLIQSFRKQDTSSRGVLLEALVDELNPYEWRKLSQRLSERRFQFDIITHLPTELQAIVFSHLEVGLLFRLQCVSKAWRYALDSIHLLKSHLLRWYGPSMANQVGFQDGDHGYLRSKAEQMVRLCHGHPTSSLTLSAERAERDSDSVILAGDNIAWLSIDLRTLHVYNLRNGSAWRARSDDLGQIFDVAASEELIAYATYKSCRVTTLDGLRSKTFRFPTALRQRFVVRHRTVATGGLRDDGAIFYIWDFDSGQQRAYFSVPSLLDPLHARGSPNYSPVWSWSIILGSDLKSITVFCSYRPQRRRQSKEVESSVSYATYSSSGQCIRSGRKCFLVDSIYLHHACLAGNDGQISIDAAGRRHGTVSQTCLNLEFDEIGYSFPEPQDPSPEISKHWLSTTIRGWNTAYYGAFTTVKKHRWDDHDADDIAGVCLGTKSAPRFVGLSKHLESADSLPMIDLQHPDFYGRLHVNDRFVVILPRKKSPSSRVDVYSFEKDFKLQDFLTGKFDVAEIV